MNPITVHLRDQLLAALQTPQAPPFSTDELARMAPPIEMLTPCRTWLHDPTRPLSPNWISHDCVDHEHHVVRRYRMGPEVYPHLRALEKKGLCARTSFENDRRVFWQYTGAPVDLSDLEAMWKASA